MARYRGETLLPYISSAGVSDDFFYYFVDVRESDRDFAKLIAADEPLQYTVLKTKSRELRNACRRAAFGVPSSKIDVV